MNISSFIDGFVIFLWGLAIICGILFAVKTSRNQPARTLFSAALVFVILAVIFSSVSSGLVFIAPGERGVVISVISEGGIRKDVLEPGIHWVMPFLENVVTYPVSRQTYTMSIAPKEGKVMGDDSISARTSDGQEIYIDASVIYAINPVKVVEVHINWRNTYEDNLVRAQARGIIRDAVSQFRVDEVNSSKRSDLTTMIAKKMTEKLSDNGLIMVDFILRNIAFSKEYSTAIEQKQIAEQQSQQAKFVVESKKQEAEQARQTAQGQADASVIRAKGEAEARTIQAKAEAQALDVIALAVKNNPDLLTYQYITKLAPNINAMLLPSNQPLLLPVPEIKPETTK